MTRRTDPRALLAFFLAATGGCAAAGPPPDAGATRVDAGASDAGAADAGPPPCTSTGEEVCGNGIDDDCDPATADACPASCADVLALDPDASDGIYTIAPAGRTADVYCDMSTDGGGWTLAISAPEAGYTELPTTEATLTPDVHGRVTDLLLTALLSVPRDETNNVRIAIDAPSAVVSMRVVLEPPPLGGPDDPVATDPLPHAARIGWQANADCAAYDAGPDEAEVLEPAESWSFLNGSSASSSSAGSTGFTDRVGRDRYLGFWMNYDTGPDLTCNRSFDVTAWYPARRGALWIR